MTEITVNGMTCTTCATHVKDALEKIPGVNAAVVSYPESRAQVMALADARYWVAGNAALDNAVENVSFYGDVTFTPSRPGTNCSGVNGNFYGARLQFAT